MTDPSHPDADTPESSAPVDRLPAYDRVQSRPGTSDEAGRRPVWKTLALLAAVVAVLVAGYLYFTPNPITESGNLLAHLIESAGEFSPDLNTGETGEAQAFVLDQLGWAVAPPDLPGLSLDGVQVAVIGQAESGGATPADVVVPAFRYQDASGEPAVVYAYDYITLDRIGSSFDLPDATYAVLGEPTPVDTRRLDGMYLVTWRRRAIIFTAVTQSEALFEQIAQAVAS